jgi:hypothetical protein
VLDRLIHEGFRLLGAARRDDDGVRDGAEGGEVGRGLVAGAVSGVLEADVREHRDHRGLRKRGHRERQIALRDTELAKGVHDRDEADLGKPAAVETMFDSAMPTSMKLPVAFWKVLMPVEPCTSLETE